MKFPLYACVLLLTACGGAQPAEPVAPLPPAAKTSAPAPSAAPETESVANVPDACSFAGETQDKYRWTVKHRPPAASAGAEAAIATLFAWDPPAGSDDVTVRTRDDPNALLDAHEGEVFVATLDLWLAKVEKNDCDWHLELSAPDAGPEAPRIIAEISQGAGYEVARSEIARLIGAKEIRSQCRQFAEPARLRLTGYGFWDGAHWMRKDPRVGHSHGSKHVRTLWELHPVWKVEVLRTGTPHACR